MVRDAAPAYASQHSLGQSGKTRRRLNLKGYYAKSEERRIEPLPAPRSPGPAVPQPQANCSQNYVARSTPRELRVGYVVGLNNLVLQMRLAGSDQGKAYHDDDERDRALDDKASCLVPIHANHSNDPARAAATRSWCWPHLPYTLPKPWPVFVNLVRSTTSRIRRMSRGMAWPRARVPHAQTKLAQYPLPLRWL